MSSATLKVNNSRKMFLMYWYCLPHKAVQEIENPWVGAWMDEHIFKCKMKTCLKFSKVISNVRYNQDKWREYLFPAILNCFFIVSCE